MSGWLQICEAATGLGRETKRVDFDVKWRWRGATTVADFTADGRTLAAVSGKDPRVVKITDAATGEERRRLEHAHDVLQVAFSRDGRSLATSAVEAFKVRQPITVWDTATGARLATVSCGASLGDYACGVVALSSKGEWLAHDEYLPDRGPEGAEWPVCRVHVRDLPAGRPRLVLDGLQSAVVKLAWSGDDRYLAVSTDSHGVFVYDCRADRWLHREPLAGSTTNAYWDLAFNPDGHRLAAVTRDQTLVWEVVSGQLLLTLRGARPRPFDRGFNPRVAWSADGRRLAASHWDHSASIWDAGERETLTAKQALYKAAEQRNSTP